MIISAVVLAIVAAVCLFAGLVRAWGGEPQLSAVALMVVAGLAANAALGIMLYLAIRALAPIVGLSG